MNTPASAASSGSSVGTSRRQSVGSEGLDYKQDNTDGGKGESVENDVDRWMLVGEKLTAEERLSEEAKKVLIADITTSLRRLIDDINEDNWMYNPVHLGYGGGQQNR